MRPPAVIALCALGFAAAAGCARTMYDPARATRPYPQALHRPESIDVQVFREGSSIEIVNSTPRSYRDFDLWINQRYVHRVDRLGAGQRLRVSLWAFYDVRGDRFSAGGFWRTEPPAPVRLVEIQPAPGEPLTGLVVIPEDD